MKKSNVTLAELSAIAAAAKAASIAADIAEGVKEGEAWAIKLDATIRITKLAEEARTAYLAGKYQTVATIMVRVGDIASKVCGGVPRNARHPWWAQGMNDPFFPLPRTIFPLSRAMAIFQQELSHIKIGNWERIIMATRDVCVSVVARSN